LEDFEQDGEENESDPDIMNDPINQIDLQVHNITLAAVLLVFHESCFLLLISASNLCNQMVF